MTQTANDPGGSVAARARRLGLTRGVRRPVPSPASAVSDDRILALVEAADGLSRRERERSADRRNAAAEERLVNLDWAVRAGRLVLAERGAGGPSSTGGAFPERQGRA